MRLKQYLTEAKKIDTVKMSAEEFKAIKKLLIKYGRRDVEDEKIAFACRLEDKDVIILNNNIFSKLNRDHQQIIITHEMIHIIDGINNEEETDRRSLKYLNKKQQDILKDSWKERHGHEYNKGE